MASSDSTLSDATNALVAVGNYQLQKKANEDNLDIARKNLGLSEQQMAYMKELQEKTWARDDNAITRMVNDLKANGFNPLLAVNTSGFNNSGVSMPSAPQLDYKEIAPQFNTRFHSNLGMIQDLENIEILRKSKELLNEKIVGQTTANIISETKALEDAYNYEYYSSRGLPTNASTLQKDLSTFLKDNAPVNKAQNIISDSFNRIEEVHKKILDNAQNHVDNLRREDSVKKKPEHVKINNSSHSKGKF